ncbi:hypothetical protein [Parasphingorhabdus sp.]|uniref:hypothetical protein n=1 Tax=Parasphingorhabdus sp. TaxID=2709688 RepID=UPI0032983540
MNPMIFERGQQRIAAPGSRSNTVAGLCLYLRFARYNRPSRSVGQRYAADDKGVAQ